MQSFLQLGTHGGCFPGGGGAVETVHVVVAESRVANERCDVHGRPRHSHRLLVGGKCGVLEFRSCAEQIHWIGQTAAQSDGRRADAAVADDDSGDALRDLWRHRGIAENGKVIMRMRIDKTRGETKAVSFNDRGALEAQVRAD